MPVFRVSSQYQQLRTIDGSAVVGARVVAVAGIARPTRFFDALRAQGHDVVRELSFPDHHWYTTSDLEQIDAAARANGADLVVTTEKDAVRLPQGTAWAVLPMTAVIEPADRFASWLGDRL
jgi:tetraacyldisaccharide 4'-kinase